MITIAKKIKDYVITDGEKFLYKNCTGKYIMSRGESMAELFTKGQAEQVLKNSVPKAMKIGLYIKKLHEPDSKQIKLVSNKDIRNNTETVMGTDYVENWLAKLSTLNGLVEDANKRKTELSEQLSSVDKDLVDLDHYIEFSNCNAYQGYIAYKTCRDMLRKRRSIKNEMAVLDIILDKEFGEVIVDVAKKQIAGMDKRKYQPRHMIELYDI